jgi:hypothetical protein
MIKLRYVTNSMQLRISWEADSRPATQEIPSILSNPKVYYRVHKGPRLILTLRVRWTQSTASRPIFFEIHFDAIHPSTLMSSQ